MTSATAVRQRQPAGKMHRHCPICESPQLDYEFVVDKIPVCGCNECGLLFLNPQPSDSLEGDSRVQAPNEKIQEIYKANAAERLKELLSYSKIEISRLVLIGADEYLVLEARNSGFEVHAYTPWHFESARVSDLPQHVDACLLFSALERMKEPFEALQIIRQTLRESGSLMVVSPTTDSRIARLFGPSWWEFNRANLFYFSADTLQNLLLKTGFGEPIIAPDRSLVSLNYLQEKCISSPGESRSHKLNAAASLSPFLRDKPFRILHGRVRFLARPVTRASRPLLSVIVPVYNEARTFVELIETLLAKTISGVDMEVIIVESNSTDGTRDLALRYGNHPRVQLILESRPRGKGYAVRKGLQSAKGDILLIQDADLEYDINDYDGLIAPILRFETNFVLGSRHGAGKNSWKMRKFNDSGLAVIFNLGHLFFLTLFNLLYGQKLKDPFTMFKVFRRDCLWGLSFECNRFDFDHELVIKLLRKGYKALELPVNYKSRSIKEGKKVTLIADPLTWIRALLKFRTSPLYGQRSAEPKTRGRAYGTSQRSDEE